MLRKYANITQKLARYYLSFDRVRLQNSINQLSRRKRSDKVVVLCNGPSLNQVDFDMLHQSGVETIGLNKINLLFPRTIFRPTYILSINRLVIEQNKAFFQETPIPVFLERNAARTLGITRAIPIQSIPTRGEFSPNIANGYIQGFTVTYAALQLAYSLGYKKMALVGCDHYFVDKGRPNQTVIAHTADQNHFSPDYFGPGISWQLPDLLGSEFHYQLAREFLLDKGIPLWNCTDGGHLEVFPRKKLTDFLNES